MKALFVQLTLLCSILLAGCGTLIGYMSECFGPECRRPHEKVEYYQAVKTDVALWNLPQEEGQITWLRWASKPILLVDFPISAVVDTLFLPFQAIVNIGKVDRENRNAETPTTKDAN